jgi:hypothetical protein
MATLRTVLPGTGYSSRSDQGIDTSEPHPVRDNADDDASRSHRQLIGGIGLLMPLLLWAFAGVRPNDAASAWKPLDSISAYFYSSAAFVFVGLLAALSLYLSHIEDSRTTCRRGTNGSGGRRRVPRSSWPRFPRSLHRMRFAFPGGWTGLRLLTMRRRHCSSGASPSFPCSCLLAEIRTCLTPRTRPGVTASTTLAASRSWRAWLGPRCEGSTIAQCSGPSRLRWLHSPRHGS